MGNASPEMLLGLAVTSIGALCLLETIFAFVRKFPDPVVILVAAWAFAGISRELSDPELLNSPTRHNAYTWDPVTLGGLALAASNLSSLNLGLAAVAVMRGMWLMCCSGSSTPKGGEHEQELMESSAQG